MINAALSTRVQKRKQTKHELRDGWIRRVPYTHGIGGPSVFVLLSLVNKETALGLLIGQNLGRQGRQN